MKPPIERNPHSGAIAAILALVLLVSIIIAALCR